MLTHLFKVTFNDTQPTYQVTGMPSTVYISHTEACPMSNIPILAEMVLADKAINQCHISEEFLLHKNKKTCR